jgi:hypothetical protein
MQRKDNAPFNNQPRKRKWEPKTKLHKKEDPKNEKQDIVKKQVSRHPNMDRPNSTMTQQTALSVPDAAHSTPLYVHATR